MPSDAKQKARIDVKRAQSKFEQTGQKHEKVDRDGQSDLCASSLGIRPGRQAGPDATLLRPWRA